MSEKNYYRSRLRNKGQITVPGKVRSILGIKEGDELVFQIDEKGRVVVSPFRIISPDQAWFWTESWQKMERDVQEDIDAGHVYGYDNVEDVIKGLHDTAGEADAED